MTPKKEENKKEEKKVEGIPANKPAPIKENKAASFNTAIVLVGKREVRRFTVELHGTGFKKLAEQFVSDRKGYEVTMKDVKPGVRCKSCGAINYNE